MMTYPGQRPAGRRAGFTLVELIVVMTIIVILATLAAAVMPSVGEKQRTTNAAGQLQSWLGIAKQWALRDQAPRGIRLLPNTQGLAYTLVYIERPDDFTGGQVSAGVTGPNVADSNGTVDFSGGFSGQGAGALQSWPVQVGDYLVMGTTVDLVFRVTQVNPATPTQLTLDRAPTLPIAATATYRIVRQPRPRTGETDLQMPDTVAVDTNTNGWYGNPLPSSGPGTPIDILFDPTGVVISPGTTSGMIQLWVRDTGEDANGNTFGGEQTLVTVYVRTGLIASNKVDITLDPNNNLRYLNPYTFTQDGRNSGL